MIITLQRTLSKNEAQNFLRELVNLGKVSWSRHARERMRERQVTTEQVLTCLKKGRLVDDPILANKGDDDAGYEITVERQVAGDNIRTVVCLKITQNAKIVTVIKI